MDLDLIKNRHQALEFLIDKVELSETIMALLKGVPDLERALSRVSLDRAGPRDLVNIYRSLAQGKEIAKSFTNQDLPEEIIIAVDKLTGHEEIISILEKAIVPEPPLLIRDGGFVQKNMIQN